MFQRICAILIMLALACSTLGGVAFAAPIDLGNMDQGNMGQGNMDQGGMKMGAMMAGMDCPDDCPHCPKHGSGDEGNLCCDDQMARCGGGVCGLYSSADFAPFEPAQTRIRFRVFDHDLTSFIPPPEKQPPIILS